MNKLGWQSAEVSQDHTVPKIMHMHGYIPLADSEFTGLIRRSYSFADSQLLNNYCKLLKSPPFWGGNENGDVGICRFKFGMTLLDYGRQVSEIRAGDLDFCCCKRDIASDTLQAQDIRKRKSILSVDGVTAS